MRVGIDLHTHIYMRKIEHSHPQTRTYAPTRTTDTPGPNTAGPESHQPSKLEHEFILSALEPPRSSFPLSHLLLTPSLPLLFPLSSRLSLDPIAKEYLPFSGRPHRSFSARSALVAHYYCTFNLQRQVLYYASLYKDVWTMEPERAARPNEKELKGPFHLLRKNK